MRVPFRVANTVWSPTGPHGSGNNKGRCLLEEASRSVKQAAQEASSPEGIPQRFQGLAHRHVRRRRPGRFGPPDRGECRGPPSGFLRELVSSVGFLAGGPDAFQLAVPPDKPVPASPSARLNQPRDSSCRPLPTAVLSGSQGLGLVLTCGEPKLPRPPPGRRTTRPDAALHHRSHRGRSTSRGPGHHPEGHHRTRTTGDAPDPPESSTAYQAIGNASNRHPAGISVAANRPNSSACPPNAPALNVTRSCLGRLTRPRLPPPTRTRPLPETDVTPSHTRRNGSRAEALQAPGMNAAATPGNHRSQPQSEISTGPRGGSVKCLPVRGLRCQTTSATHRRLRVLVLGTMFATVLTLMSAHGSATPLRPRDAASALYGLEPFPTAGRGPGASTFRRAGLVPAGPA